MKAGLSLHLFLTCVPSLVRGSHWPTPANIIRQEIYSSDSLGLPVLCCDWWSGAACTDSPANGSEGSAGGGPLSKANAIFVLQVLALVLGLNSGLHTYLYKAFTYWLV